MTAKIKNRHRLKDKDIQKIKDKLKNSFNENFFDKNTKFETGDIKNYNLIFVDDEPVLMHHNKKITFTLTGLNKYKPKNNYVIVDMGAIKFVTNGADVMAPGIIDADKKIEKNNLVWICDERHKKPLATGISLMTGEQMITQKKGKSVTVFHYVGDPLWILLAKSL